MKEAKAEVEVIFYGLHGSEERELQ